MKLRLIQKDVRNKSYVDYLTDVETSSVDMVCMGELATSGCLYDGGEGMATEDLLADLSPFDFAIGLGFPRRETDGLRNSYLYFQHGQCQIYDKINLFEPMNEPAVYGAGSRPGIFETEFGKLGVAICYDIRFPEVFERLRKAGVDRIFVPAAFPRARIADWRELIVQRARETGVHVVGINAVGNDGVNEFGGCSMVADPSGEILVQADETSEQVVVVEI